jgi:hypothetical protein
MAIPPDLLKQFRVSLVIFDANALLSSSCTLNVRKGHDLGVCPLNVRKGHDLGACGLASHDKRQFGYVSNTGLWPFLQIYSSKFEFL